MSIKALRVLLWWAAPRKNTYGNRLVPVVDAHARDTFSQLTDEQLRDVGIYRELRHVRWDLFDRSFPPDRKLIFDYFRLGD